MRILKTLPIAVSQNVTGQTFLRAWVASAFLVLLSSISIGQQQKTGPDSTLSFGDPRGPIRIEVFYDLQCRSCVPIHDRLKKAVEKFPGKVFVTVRHYPLPLHENAFLASSAVEAARKQGKAIRMMELLLRNQEKWGWARKPFGIFLGYAAELRLDISTFRKDVTSDDVIRLVLYDMNRGKGMKVDSTPFIYLNGNPVSFAEAYEIERVIQKVIDSEVIKIG